MLFFDEYLQTAEEFYKQANRTPQQIQQDEERQRKFKIFFQNELKRRCAGPDVLIPKYNDNPLHHYRYQQSDLDSQNLVAYHRV